MNCIKMFRMAILVVIGLFIFIPVAQGQTPFDFTECLAGTSTTVYESKEIRIGSTEGKGIIFSHHENKVFDNCTFHVVSIAKVVDGKRRSDSYWKIMDPDGDIIIAELVVLGPEKTMKFLLGNGKASREKQKVRQPRLANL